MKKIKVLEVIYGFEYGGIRAFIMNYLRHIDKTKFEVDIYVFGWDSSPFTEQVHQLGANIYFEPENNASKRIPRFIKQLYTFMKSHGPYDVVHAHTNLISAWVLLAAKMAKAPIRLSHSHSTAHFSSSFIQRLYSHLRLWLIDKLATKKLACGQLAGEAMYLNKDFEIIANGIPLEKYINRNEVAISKLRSKLSIPEGVRVYANVTRMDPSKNHLFAVEVFNEIHKLDTTAIFVYGGVIPKIAPTYDVVINKIKEYDLEEYCRFTGPLMDIEQLYHLSDAWIYCSSYEGLPFGPLELQAAGIPVLASDVITKEIDMGLGLLHFISLNASPTEWAKTAMRVNRINNPEDRIYKAFSIHNFDIRQSVKTLEDIYTTKV